jgi:hypothetical protein
MEPHGGFWGGRSCIDSVFSLKGILKRIKEFNLETRIFFINYETASDQVNRPKLFNILYNGNIPDPYFQH